MLLYCLCILKRSSLMQQLQFHLFLRHVSDVISFSRRNELYEEKFNNLTDRCCCYFCSHDCCSGCMREQQFRYRFVCNSAC